jgi:hypothetical protein
LIVSHIIYDIIVYYGIMVINDNKWLYKK